jgi:urease accessory protein
MNYLVWQLIDSGFPAGGYPHSAGLEASLHHGHVRTPADVSAYARQMLTQTGRSSLPIVTATHRDPVLMGELDGFVDVFLSNPVANRASRGQGRGFLSSAVRCFPDAHLGRIEEEVRTRRLPGHHAPLFGVVLSALGVELLDTQRAFLFTSCRTVAAAAVRLGIIGGYEAQEVQRLLSAEIDSTVARCGALLPGEIAHTSPLADLYQSTHDRLYSRLFQS